MRAIEFSTELEAINRNREQAIAMGCSGITLYWWSMEQINGKYYLLIGDDFVDDEVVEINV